MKSNILHHYGFLTRREFETHCFQIVFSKVQVEKTSERDNILDLQWEIRSVNCAYPKSTADAIIELRHRGLDPGNETYGLSRVIESGDVRLTGGMWKKSDIDLAMISLAELGCIEPWIHACHSFNVKPVEYIKTFRFVAEKNIEKLKQYAAEPLFYRFEFQYGQSLAFPGTVSITLRDDWEQVARLTLDEDNRAGRKNG